LGRVRIDNYAWLKPENWKAVWKNPSKLGEPIRSYLKAENTYAKEVLSPTASLQEKLFSEMLERSGGDDMPPPYPVGAWLYYQRIPPGAQYASWYRKPRDGQGSEELLVNGAARAHGRESFGIQNARPSPNQHFFAWAEDVTGSGWHHIYVKDLKTGRILPHPIENAYGQFVFSADSKWIFWVHRSANSRPSKVFRRRVGGHGGTLVYHEKDPNYLMTVSTTSSGKYVMIRSWNADSSEVRLIPAEKPTQTPQVVEPRTNDLVYSVEDWNGQFVILTNADGAANYKLMRTGESSPGRENWKDWVPYDPNVFITGMRAFRDYFVRTERKDVNPRVVVSRRGEKPKRTIAHSEGVYAMDVLDHQEYDSSTIRYLYQSPRYSKRWIDHDMSTGESTTLKKETVAGGFNADDYIVELIHAVASDGEKVPISILRRKHTRLDGNAPLLMQSYGSYGYFAQPDFQAPLFSLVDRGWIYAFAYVRGGSAKGWTWYTQARRLHKKLSFTDFTTCADTLIKKKYTNSGRIVVYGFSAGGLMTGAVLNMRPDLFCGAIGEAPFVDVLNTMSDPTHPLVPLTYPDWGNPLKSRAVYDYIASYSPYDNVRDVAYPPVLATTSIADNRVGFWEPAKWIAKLRHDDTSSSPKLLRVEKGGHGGSSGRQAKLRQTALFYAFSIWALGYQ
jgi:oligopeptidase B